jgi:hypothetical protein
LAGSAEGGIPKRDVAVSYLRSGARGLFTFSFVAGGFAVMKITACARARGEGGSVVGVRMRRSARSERRTHPRNGQQERTRASTMHRVETTRQKKKKKKKKKKKRRTADRTDDCSYRHGDHTAEEDERRRPSRQCGCVCPDGGGRPVLRFKCSKEVLPVRPCRHCT